MSDPLPEGFDRDAWRAKHWDFANENVPKWFDAVRAKYGKETTKYACTGYCFGAPFVCNLLAGDGVSAGAFAHPTSLKEEHFLKLKRECGTMPEARAGPEALSVALRSVLTRADVQDRSFCLVLRTTMRLILIRGGRLSISCRGRRRRTICSYSKACRMALQSRATQPILTRV